MKRLILFIVGVIIVIGLIGLLINYSNITGLAVKTDQKVVRIGYIFSDHHAAFFVAKEKKLYESQGIKVEEKGFFWGGPLIEALSTGNVDIGYVGTSPAIIGRANDNPVTVIAAVQNEGSGIAVSKELYEKGIDSLKELKGKKIAHTGIGSVPHVLLLKELEKVGLTKDDVDLKIIAAPEMQMVLENGEIDAFVVFQPWLSKAKNEGAVEVIKTSNEMWLNHPCCVMVANEGFIENNKDLIESLVYIHKEATSFINTNRKETVKIVAKNLGLDERTVQESMTGMEYSINPNIDAINEFANMMYNLKLINKKPNADEFVKLDFLEKIL